MRASDTLMMCLRNLYKRKLRTLLTLLGVMIGTGSIILMISLGLATDAQFAQMIEDMNIDMTMIEVWPGGGFTMNMDGSIEELPRQELTDEMIERIERIPGVALASPTMQGWFLFRSGPYVMHVGVTGMRAEALSQMGVELQEGRFLEPGEEFAAVFSHRTEKAFYDMTDRNAWGSDRQWDFSDETTLVDVMNDPIHIFIDSNWFYSRRGMESGDGFGESLEDSLAPVRSFEIDVVGVLADGNSGMVFRGFGDTIYMDIETLQMLNQMSEESWRREREENEHFPHFSAVQDGPRQTYNEMFVRAESMDVTGEVAAAIEELGFFVWYMGDIIEQQREMQRGIETLLSAIAAVSLAVAAINIANTMITSVTERTREIGVMKVIGASIRDIRRLFLVESVIIGLMGGLCGVLLALGFSYAMNNWDVEFLNNLNLGAPWPTAGVEGAAISIITPWLCGLALLVAGGVGLISGYYPAWRATRLSALAAIRGD